MALTCKNSVWNIHDTCANFQPTRFFGYHVELLTVNCDSIDGYEWWIQLSDDVSGLYVNIYYPLNAKNRRNYTVLVRGAINKDIPHKHGESGLFKNKILPLLEAFNCI